LDILYSQHALASLKARHSLPIGVIRSSTRKMYTTYT